MKNRSRKHYLVEIGILFLWLTGTACNRGKPAIVFQSDFGLKDGAVSTMKGVCAEVDPDLKLYDLCHEIPVYNIWEAAYRLQQTAPYWPKGTIFVSVVDPGVGTDRKSVVLKSKTGHYFVTPDNGTLSLISEALGIESIRRIDEEFNRRKNSLTSYTFHGRDVYAYTAARFASGMISFEEIGELLPDIEVRLSYQRPLIQGDSILGNIPILDTQYGNVWTNIADSLLEKLGIRKGDSIAIRIQKNNAVIFAGTMQYVATFGEVAVKNTLCYINSLMNVSFALNMDSFSDSFKVQSGAEWNVVLKENNLGK